MQTENLPLISIIIPVYQVEKYLKRCLKSIVQQTYPNIEIVLVDDGSTDGSAKICDDFAEKYGQKFSVQVFHNANAGAAAARNYGLQYAKGALITFIDSDDVFTPEFLEITQRVMQQKNVKLVQTSYTSHEKEYREHLAVTEPKTEIYTNEEAFRNYILDDKITGYIWGKLYDASLFEKVRYPEKITHGQDSYTTFKFLLLAEKMAFVDEVLYYYCRHEDTLTGTFSTNRMKLCKVADEMRKFVSEEGYDQLPDIRKLIESYEIQMNFMILNYYIGHGQDQKYQKELLQVRKAILRADWKNPYIKKKYRIMHFLLKLSYPLFRFSSVVSQKALRNRYW